MGNLRIIAAVRSGEELNFAVESSVEIIFMLAPNIATLKEQADSVHKAGKKLFIHLDLAEGIGKDEYGILFAKEQGADGIISTRTNIIKLAKKAGMFTVQRFFIVDSHSIDTTIESLKSSKPDMIEIMPGIISKVIKKLKKELDMPIQYSIKLVPLPEEIARPASEVLDREKIELEKEMRKKIDGFAEQIRENSANSVLKTLASPDEAIDVILSQNKFGDVEINDDIRSTVLEYIGRAKEVESENKKKLKAE